MASEPKLSYSPNLLRVKVELSQPVCRQAELPPSNLVTRVKKKLDEVRASGEVESFYIYESRLKEIWQRLREAVSFKGPLVMTLGAGTPKAPPIDVKIETPQNAEISVTVAAAAAASLANWRFEWFKVVLMRKAREAGFKRYLNQAQLMSLFMHLKAGHGVDCAIIQSIDELQELEKEDFSVVSRRRAGDVSVVIRQPQALEPGGPRQKLAVAVQAAVEKLGGTALGFRTFERNIEAVLTGAIQGPERLGYDLPLVLLAAKRPIAKANPSDLVAREHAAGLGAASEETRRITEADYPGKGRLTIDVSSNGLVANISNFDNRWYDDNKAPVTEEWLLNEGLRLGLEKSLVEEAIKTCSSLIAKKTSLNKIVLAKGREPVQASVPYLDAIFKKAPSKDAEEDTIDMRASQQRTLVKAGNVIAAVRYRVPAEPGMDVYGAVKEALFPEPTEIEVGEGIERTSDDKFIASWDGIPTVKGMTISLAIRMVHKGNVNLRSGDIKFDGPVEIKGSVEIGATVETTSDLLIHGDIAGGTVSARGDLTVKGSIITGPTARVDCGGTITASFCENSSIKAKKDIVIASSLSNSLVVCDGNIVMTNADATLAGGHIYCAGNIETANLGFLNGSPSQIEVGVNHGAVTSMANKTARSKALEAMANEYRLQMRQLIQKNRQQMTRKHEERRDFLQNRLGRIRVLLERCDEQIKHIEHKLTYNRTSYIIVREQLSRNIDLQISGKNIILDDDYAGVAVTSKRVGESYVVSLDAFEKERARQAAKSTAKDPEGNDIVLMEHEPEPEPED